MPLIKTGRKWGSTKRIGIEFWIKLDCEEKTLAQEMSKKGNLGINTLRQEHWAAQKITFLQHICQKF